MWMMLLHLHVNLSDDDDHDDHDDDEFQKSFTVHKCQTVWIQIRPNDSLGLIWVQTVSKGYHQTTLGSDSIRDLHFNLILWSSFCFCQNKHCSYCAT